MLINHVKAIYFYLLMREQRDYKLKVTMNGFSVVESQLVHLLLPMKRFARVLILQHASTLCIGKYFNIHFLWYKRFYS